MFSKTAPTNKKNDCGLDENHTKGLFIAVGAKIFGRFSKSKALAGWPGKGVSGTESITRSCDVWRERLLQEKVFLFPLPRKTEFRDKQNDGQFIHTVLNLA